MKPILKKTIIISVPVLIVVSVLLIYSGINRSFVPPKDKYPITGIDISHYQTHIDWKILKEENNISFIYIKATEGAYTIDEKFKSNWINAMKNNYKVGAYHFYIPNRTGKDQAKMFIETVPNIRKTLPPVIDLEFPINNKSGKTKELIIDEIYDFLIEIESHYNRKPLIYTNISFYNNYIKGNFDKYKLWIRDDEEIPRVDEDKWVIWQYTERGRIKGIKGPVDVNVLNGTWKDLD